MTYLTCSNKSQHTLVYILVYISRQQSLPQNLGPAPQYHLCQGYVPRPAEARLWCARVLWCLLFKPHSIDHAAVLKSVDLVAYACLISAGASSGSMTLLCIEAADQHNVVLWLLCWYALPSCSTSDEVSVPARQWNIA